MISQSKNKEGEIKILPLKKIGRYFFMIDKFTTELYSLNDHKENKQKKKQKKGRRGNTKISPSMKKFKIR